MATPPPRGRRLADAARRKSVMTSVRLDAALHSRMSAAASLAGKDKSRFIADVIAEALQGLIIIDKRGRGASPDPDPTEIAPPDESTQ